MLDNYFSATIPAYPPGASLPKSKTPLPPQAIADAVCRFYCLLPSDLQGGGREHSKAKQIYRFLLFDEGVSLRRIARMCAVSFPAARKSVLRVQGYLDVGEPYIAEIWALKGQLVKM